ncbi:hypothetical protein CLOM_g9283 [Closterium sp. NIES-68]|nr:hypothetical protein CLOM_g9283 [Closterium sp. NIES-68]
MAAATLKPCAARHSPSLGQASSARVAAQLGGATSHEGGARAERAREQLWVVGEAEECEGGEEGERAALSEFLGTCPDMCPARERATRERLRDLAVFERRHDDPSRTSPVLAVKKFSRTLGTGGVAVPREDIRPPPVLMRALAHLMGIVLGEGGSEGGWRGGERGGEKGHAWVLGEGRMSEGVYEFVSDRMRGMRQDMAMQRVTGHHAVLLLAPMVRFHAAAAYELATAPPQAATPAVCAAGATAAGTAARGGGGGGSSAGWGGRGRGRGEDMASAAGRRNNTASSSFYPSSSSSSSATSSAVHRFDAHLNLRHLAEALRSLLFAFSTCRQAPASSHVLTGLSARPPGCTALAGPSSGSSSATSGITSSSSVQKSTGVATDPGTSSRAKGDEAVDSWGDDLSSEADAEGVRRSWLQGTGADGGREEQQEVESWEEREEEGEEGGQMEGTAGTAVEEPVGSSRGGGGVHGEEEEEEVEDEEGEFTSLYVILHMAAHSHMAACEWLAPMLSSLHPSIVRSSHMRLALSLLRCYRTNNAIRFFRLVRERATYLQACLLHLHFSSLRAVFLKAVHASGYRHHPVPLHHLAPLLLLDSEQQLQALCQHLGLPLTPLDCTPPGHGPAMALVPREPLQPAGAAAAGEGSGKMAPCAVVDGKRPGFRLGALVAPL